MRNTLFTVLCILYTIVCLGFAVFRWYTLYASKPESIDATTLIFFFAGVGFSFLPFASKLKFLGILEIERLKEEVSTVKSALIMREVVSDPAGNKFYVDEEGKHPLPDDETARFLASHKGVIQLSWGEISKIANSSRFGSVKSAPLRILSDTHIFVILGAKKYYVPSWSFLADWRRSDYTPASADELANYPTGR